MMYQWLYLQYPLAI